MTDFTLVLNGSNSTNDTVEALYTADLSSSVQIKAFTATNNQEASRDFKAYIYNSAGTGLAIIPTTLIPRDFTDHGSAIVGHLIPAGGTLRLSSSVADIVFNVTGALV